LAVCMCDQLSSTLRAWREEWTVACNSCMPAPMDRENATRVVRPVVSERVVLLQAQRSMPPTTSAMTSRPTATPTGTERRNHATAHTQAPVVLYAPTAATGHPFLMADGAAGRPTMVYANGAYPAPATAQYGTPALLMDEKGQFVYATIPQQADPRQMRMLRPVADASGAYTPTPQQRQASDPMDDEAICWCVILCVKRISLVGVCSLSARCSCLPMCAVLFCFCCFTGGQ
jgi:hypothetical protein